MKGKTGASFYFQLKEAIEAENISVVILTNPQLYEAKLKKQKYLPAKFGVINLEALPKFDLKKIARKFIRRISVLYKDILPPGVKVSITKEVAKVGKKYIPCLYINRGIEKEFDKFVIDGVKETEKSLKKNKNCFLIIDRAGCGKTNLLCSLAKKYSEKQPTIFILGNLHLKDEFSIEERIKTLLEYDPRIIFLNFHQCMNTINNLVEKKETNFLVFIDAINENPNTELMKKALENILSKHTDKKIKFCVTCRDIYWDFFKAEFWKNYVEKKIHNSYINLKKTNFQML